MTDRSSREIRLASRPAGTPDASNFEIVDVPLVDPADGQILVRNLFMSVDPYMRGRMRDRKSYVPPFQVGEVLEGGAIGEVVESKNERYAVGDHVISNNGWREAFLSTGRGLRKVDASLAPLSAYLGVLGMPGFTAHYGLLEIGQPKEGETVFVSGAAGAVGSVVCQIAKAKGCRVVGSAGSDAKVDWLESEGGVDVGIDYKTAGNLRRAVLEACPNGIDIYFDNVGGDHLEAALWGMNDFGRMIACGAISAYNATEPTPGPGNLFFMVTKRLLWKGFIISDHYDRLGAFTEEMAGWLADGTVRWRETVYEGLDSAPEAFLGLFTGENLGKMVVKLG